MPNVASLTHRVVAKAATALLVLVATSGAARAQMGRITGIVTDSASGTPVAGVNILITGSRLGAMTAEDGRFVINSVPAATYSVEARRLGYLPVRRLNVVVTAGQATTADFKIQAAALHLQETVVTGVVDPTAGTKVPFTVGRVTKEDAPVPPINAIAGVQGKIAGVSTVPPSQPGDGISIQLRSPKSISKSNSPLLVVDGVILSESSADLNALDIESMEVVKGAAATSLYGSRAASGVIQIRTSRGNGLSFGQTQFTLRSEMGASSLGHEVEWAKYHYFMTNDKGEYINAAGAVVPRSQRVQRPAATRFQDVSYAVPTYDPVSQFFNPGQYMTNSFTIAQNGEKTNFLTTLSNQRQAGVILDHGQYTRNDVRINLDHRPRDDVQLSISGYHARSDREELNGNTFFWLINVAPDVNLLDPDPDGTKYIFQPDPIGVHPSPLYLLETNNDRTQRVRTLGAMDLRYTPKSWLSFDGNFSYDRSDRNESNFTDRGVKTEAAATGGVGSLSLTNNWTNALNGSLSANLLQQFGELTARSTARILLEQEKNQSSSATGNTFVVAGVPRLDAALSRNSSSSESQIQSEGYFLTLGLDYGSRYIIDALVRRDASSLFGPGEKWHTYYRASGAYRMAEERWWPFKSSINEFKFRVSQGTAGTRPAFADQYETYSIGSNGTLTKSALGNRFLKPEVSTETETGIDMIVKNRYSLQLSYAKTKTSDEIISIPLPGAIGFTSQWQNAGTVVGNTFEGTIEAQLYRKGSTSWKMGLIADRSRHHIQEFGRACFRTNTISYRCPGEDLSTMYGLAFLHSADQLPAALTNAKDQFEVNDDGLLVWVGPGGHWTDAKWGTPAVINGVTYPWTWGQPIIRQDSTGQSAVVRIGSGNPKFHWGVSNNVNWKGLQVYGLVDAQVGGQIYNQNNQRMYQYQRSGDVDQVGKSSETKKTVNYYDLLYNGNQIMDWFVEPGGFVKLREVSAKYQLPKSLVSRVPGNRAVGASISVIGRNLLTWTKYSGYDPEVGSTINKIDSYDFDVSGSPYPQSRTLTGVLQIQF